VNRLRVGFALTGIIGMLLTAFGLFDSMVQLAAGIVVAAAGLIGYCAVDYVDNDRSFREDYRDQVWARRDGGW
jgi:hypothetical protein